MALYRRLTLMEREELSRMLAAGYSLRATARARKGDRLNFLANNGSGMFS